MWTYSQTTGELHHNGELVTKGYSGHGKGRNNPDMESTHGVDFKHDAGPIPKGKWRISVDPPKSHPKLLDPVIRFTPCEETNTFGRSGFLSHGNNVGNDASLGCIILNYHARIELATSLDTLLVVVQ